MKNWKICLPAGRTKIKIIAVLAVSFVVFATTLFVIAQNNNGNSLFLDSDQDGLTDQEERMIGTDPAKADTDGDGYSDGKEVESGYNPLKAAPGDKIIAAPSSVPTNTPTDAKALTDKTVDKQAADQIAVSGDLLEEMTRNNLISNDIFSDISSDPSNPNLTNEMIGQLMKLTENKISTLENFAENPNYSSEELQQVAQNTLEAIDITKDLPEIPDSELNILPEIKDKKLSEDKIKEKQKAEIEKYLAQSAFILASNSPFNVESASSLEASINNESTNLLTALVTGNSSKVESYAQKAQTGIDQLKKVEVPYILKDIHKSMLQLAIYTLDLKDEITLNTSDPVKSLTAVLSLETVAQNATKLQEEFSQTLSNYGIEFINFP